MKTRLHTWVVVSLLFVSGYGWAHAAPATKTTVTDIHMSFAELKQALNIGDRDRTVAHMSSGTLALFEGARRIALNPDVANSNAFSQLEVLIGFQGRWLLGTNTLRTMSTAELFAWGARNGIVPIGGLATVDLRDVQIDGSHAVAHIAGGAVTLKNTVLSFELQKGKWRLDLREILLASEEALGKVRDERHLTKAEMAVLALEGVYKQAIPELRELLLSPEIRQKVTELKAAPPSKVYESIMSELSGGRQRTAEQMLEVFVGIHTNDQRLAFLQAVCARSRWSKAQAGWQFKRVLEIDPTTLEGNCSRYVLDLDRRQRVPENMKALGLLIARNPDNPLLLWVMAIEARDHFRHTGETTYSKEAERCYRRLLQIFDIGPVLLHQTFANVLTEELNLPDEALKYRRIAVELEPAPWTYQGLANTLSKLKKYDEANEAFAKLIELDPGNAEFWLHWAWNLCHQGRYVDSIEKSSKVIEIDPSSAAAYDNWAFCLEKQNKDPEALEKYRKAIALDPTDRYAYKGCIGILKSQHNNAEALRMREQRDRIPTARSGFISTNLTDATRPAFLGQLKGADLQTLASVFGEPASREALGPDTVCYTIKSWRGWEEIGLVLAENDGLVTIAVRNSRGRPGGLEAWREALWRDFGIKTDRIRLVKTPDIRRNRTRLTNTINNVSYYFVAFEDRPPGVGSICSDRLLPSDVINTNGISLDAVKADPVMCGLLRIVY